MTLSTAELVSIQQDLVAQVCDQTVQLYQPTGASDAYASPANSYTLASTTVCGMSKPSAGDLANYDFKIGDKAAWTLHFPVGTVVGEQWRAVIAGQTLEIHVLLTPQSYMGLLDVIAAEIK